MGYGHIRGRSPSKRVSDPPPYTLARVGDWIVFPDSCRLENVRVQAKAQNYVYASSIWHPDR